MSTTPLSASAMPFSVSGAHHLIDVVPGANDCKAIVLYHTCGCRSEDINFFCYKHKEEDCPQASCNLIVGSIPFACRRSDRSEACQAENPADKEFLREADTADRNEHLIVLRDCARTDICDLTPSRAGTESQPWYVEIQENLEKYRELRTAQAPEPPTTAPISKPKPEPSFTSSDVQPVSIESTQQPEERLDVAKQDDDDQQRQPELIQEEVTTTDRNNPDEDINGILAAHPDSMPKEIAIESDTESLSDISDPGDSGAPLRMQAQTPVTLAGFKYGQDEDDNAHGKDENDSDEDSDDDEDDDDEVYSRTPGTKAGDDDVDLLDFLQDVRKKPYESPYSKPVGKEAANQSKPQGGWRSYIPQVLSGIS